MMQGSGEAGGSGGEAPAEPSSNREASYSIAARREPRPPVLSVKQQVGHRHHQDLRMHRHPRGWHDIGALDAVRDMVVMISSFAMTQCLAT